MRNRPLLALLLTVSSCAWNDPATHGTNAASLLPTLEVRTIDASRVLTFDFVNMSARPLMFAEAFGYDFYFHVEIVADDGTPVHIPKWELTREIHGRCIAPGEKRSFRVPLNRWSPVTGTDATCNEEPCTGVRLLPGTYRLRAIYRPIRGNALGEPCDHIPGVLTSEWVRFAV